MIQQAEADNLADDGRPAGTGNTHVKYEDQQWVHSNIQHRTADDTNHCVIGAALKTKLIVQYKRGRHPRRAEENDTQVRLCIGENRGSGTEQVCKRFQKDLTNDADQQTCKQGCIEACGRPVGCFPVILFAKFS